MIRNYIIIAWRNLLKGKSYSAINILGMGLGIGICLMIFLFVQEEWSFDHFHTKKDRIYRAWVKEHFKGDIFFNSVTPYLLGTELADNFPDIDEMARMTTINSLIRKDNRIEEELVHLVDPGFFKIFDFPVLEGSYQELLNLHSVAITEDFSKKYYGSTTPLGQRLTLQVGGEWTDFTVGAVLQNAPSNSSFQFGVIIPFENTKSFTSEGGRKCWTCVSVETYVLVNKQSNIASLEKSVAPFIDKKVAEDYQPGEYIIGFQLLTDIHLNNAIPTGIVSVSDSRYPYILAGIALLILLLACINFTTLSVGRSVSRSKEVGIRKVTGATRKQLMFQFWSEAFITVLGGIVAGLIIARLGLPFFNQLADKELALQPNLSIITGLLILFIITGILSGIYPALVLSGFRPIHALHSGAQSKSMTKGSILSGLVGLQFVLSVGLIICTAVMQNQLRFLQNKNLGYDKTHVINLQYNVSGATFTDMWAEAKKIQQRLLDITSTDASILGIASSSHVFGSQGWLSLGYTDDEQNRFRKFNTLYADEKFLPLMNIELLEGRYFSKDIPTDAKAVIVNKAMVNEFDLADPIGKYLPKPFDNYQIIGVTDDFHFSSLHQPILPLVMNYDLVPFIQTAPDLSFIDQPNPKLSIKISGDDVPSTIKSLESAWKEVASDQAFAYSFMDEAIDQQYKTESKLKSILGWSTALAIIIACMGLFGISALKLAFKTKEIGIRKVLGASSMGILGRLSHEYIKLILIAAVIASPIAWFAMNKWLQDFAFHIPLKLGIFAFATLLTTVVALVAVSFQSIKAAWADPVKSLRTE